MDKQPSRLDLRRKSDWNQLKPSLTVSVLATSDEWRLGVPSLLLSSPPPCNWHRGMISTWTSICSTQWLLHSAASRSSAPRYDSLKWNYCLLTHHCTGWNLWCLLNIYYTFIIKTAVRCTKCFLQLSSYFWACLDILRPKIDFIRLRVKRRIAANLSFALKLR